MSINKIMITGNMGYIGSAVIRELKTAYPGTQLIGLDTGYFSKCLSCNGLLPEQLLDVQFYCDARKIDPEILKDVDVIVYLSAISNDIMGKIYSDIVMDINSHSAYRLALQAKAMGAKSFVFASSCSVYGFAEGTADETTLVNPLTDYAKSKHNAEIQLKELADENFNVTCLRFATACGMSDRLRLDLVLNDFVASAVKDKRITIMSDGTPWRPLIHLKDMARAINWAIRRPGENGGAFLCLNIGSNEWNYQVRDFANAVKEALPDISVSINQNAAPDKRSYKVNFDLFRQLAPDHQPKMTLGETISELIQGIGELDRNRSFNQAHYIRLDVLNDLKNKGYLSNELFWNHRL